MSFKLIAIRPLTGCNEQFLKNLDENRIYKFYNEYSFKNKIERIIENTDKSYVHFIEFIPSVSENLYNKNNLNINISAIVGENGSGKSTIVELLYVAFYNFSIYFDILIPNTDDEVPQTISDNEVAENLQIINSFFSSKSLSNRKNAEKSLKKLYDRVDYLTYLKNKNKHPRKNEFEKINKINVEIFFQSNEKGYSLKFNNGKIYLNDFTNNEGNFTRDNASDKILDKQLFDSLKKEEWLFYNLSINYSLYSLNSLEMGNWIENLFHKNDSYQTPIVLNPFRNKGNIDIKNETDLTKSRLLVNIIEEESLREINDNKIISDITLSINKEKLDEDFIKLLKDSERHLLFESVHKIFIKDISITTINTNYKKDIENYISNKLSSIAKKYKKYERYKKLFNFYRNHEYQPLKEDLEKYLNLLEQDKSHITYKLKQAINFLYYGEYLLQAETKKLKLSIDSLKIELDKIIVKKQKFFPKVEVIEIIPPSFLSTDYYLNKDSKNVFSKLSSGEKQKIFSFSTIIYHLKNIDSVSNEEDNEDMLITYKNINLIFDEIELYYHPNFQKSFIKNLVEYIDRANLKNIKNINCTFITHSPFILSDIPKQNVLFLEKGQPLSFTRMNTFGANITDLLADSFFINDGLIGDFAKNKIEETISWLNSILDLKEIIKKIESENKDKLNEKKIRTAKNEIRKYLSKEIDSKNIFFKQHFKLIEIIDEPFLRIKLEEMYSEATFEFFQKELLEKQIAEMQEQLENL